MSKIKITQPIPARIGDFQIVLGTKGSAGEFFHIHIIIKLGLYFDFLMVSTLPRRPRFSARLPAKLSNVGGANPTFTIV